MKSAKSFKLCTRHKEDHHGALTCFRCNGIGKPVVAFPRGWIPKKLRAKDGKAFVISAGQLTLFG